jgi:hypothetical protein
VKWQVSWERTEAEVPFLKVVFKILYKPPLSGKIRKDDGGLNYGT